MTREKHTIAMAEDALEALLRKLVAIDLKRDASAGAKSIMGTPFDFDKNIPTRSQSLIADLARRPIEEAVRYSIRFVGVFLFEETHSTDAMLAVAERVCARSRDHGGRWLSIVDHAWDGIGEGADVRYA